MRPVKRTGRKGTDVMTPEQRRKCMSNIKGRDTGPEVSLRSALWAAGLRYRLRQNLPGKPDITFGVSRLAVFVDGCFWHGCPIHGHNPKSNKSYWLPKLKRNKLRAKAKDKRLKATRWKIWHIWEHELVLNKPQKRKN